MRLLLDIGNTRAKIASARGMALTPVGLLEHRELSNAKLTELFADYPQPDQIWLGSVASKAITAQLEDWLVERFDCPSVRATVSADACGVHNGYAKLNELGVDRWLAILGAAYLHRKQDVIIIDAGTAVTVDFLSRQGVFEGGAILPGYQLMHDALVGNTAGITSRPAVTSQVVGKTTEECVNSGLGYGLAGAIERVVFEMQQQLASPATCLITGGGADVLQSLLRLECQAQPQLVLSGLAALAIESD